MSIKSYHELIKIESFNDRLKYLSLGGKVGDFTFGGHRYLNQILYRSSKWKEVRRQVIIRDDGHDLAHEDYQIIGPIYIHHINPITIDDLLKERAIVYDLDNLVSSSYNTHNEIHYGITEHVEPGRGVYTERTIYDTCPWKL